MLSERSGDAVAIEFLMRTVGDNSLTNEVVIDKSGVNLAGLHNMKCLLILNGWYALIEIMQVKYRNNIIEQSHRFIKRLKHKRRDSTFSSAAASLKGIEVADMIRKQQFDNDSGLSAFQKSTALAG